MTLAWIGLSVLLGVDPAGASTSSGFGGGGVSTRDFRVCCCGTAVDPDRIATDCERLRTRLRETWLPSDADQPWTPRCQIVVHPTLASYVRTLGPGSEGTSGCSTIELDSGRVVVRRIDLRADATGWLTETLAHEMAHVVLADRFSSHRIPRWADEGIAILAETVEKQQLRERTWLAESQLGRPFSARDLFTVDAPPPANRHNAFYGQSASLVRFLVTQRNPVHLLGFVDAVQKHGPTKALRDWYAIDGVEHLEREWAARRPAPATTILLGDRMPLSAKVGIPVAD